MTAHKSRKPFWLASNGIAAILFIGAVGYFLVIEHREHLFAWLPWLILALCPLIHIFMHGGHGHGHNHNDDRDGGYDEGDNHRHKHDE